MAELAIVIPAFKANHFEKTLQSIANQTNRNFTLYIGDDCSPDDLSVIVNNFRNSINVIYKRFEKNIGEKNLIKQWERCIELTNHEPWIWLFSDDDLMGPLCVESFHENRKTTDVDLFRFDIKVIDGNNEVISISENPEYENSIDFIKSRLKLERSSSVTNCIFSRKIYESEYHFNNFTLAWCADDAAWLKFGRQKGIFTIKGNYVSWRNSDHNISNNITSRKFDKVQAQIQFLQWLYKYNIRYMNSALSDNAGAFRQLTYNWLFDITFKLNLNYFQIFKFSILVSKLYKTSAIIEFERYCKKKPIIKALKLMKRRLLIFIEFCVK